MQNNYTYIYLHGFASSPISTKAQYFKDQFKQLNYELTVPDLNQDDFSSITLSSQLKQATKLIERATSPVILIGSSMGGLLATMLAENNPVVAKLVLLAPAFAMNSMWSNFLTEEQLNQWQENGELDIFHYGFDQEKPLKYEFIRDLNLYNCSDFKRKLPTLIFHGASDEIVAFHLSQQYLEQNHKAQLIRLDDDHSLEKHLDYIWVEVKQFCKL